MMNIFTLFGLWGLLALLSGCSRLPPPNSVKPVENYCPAVIETGCTFEVRGACVVVTDSVPACGTNHSELQAETESAVNLAGNYWSADSNAVIQGWTITVYADPVPCGEVDAGGCTYSNGCDQVTATVLGGCYQSLLVHEFGHMVISDWQHTDPRWAYWTGAQEKWCGVEGLISF